MNKTMYCADYYYFRNKRGICVCFHFKFKKRVKTKLLEFLKNEHDWNKINMYCRSIGLRCEFDYRPSKQYAHNYIYDI